MTAKLSAWASVVAVMPVPTRQGAHHPRINAANSATGRRDKVGLM
jgi:hypothetical protein